MQPILALGAAGEAYDVPQAQQEIPEEPVAAEQSVKPVNEGADTCSHILWCTITDPVSIPGRRVSESEEQGLQGRNLS